MNDSLNRWLTNRGFTGSLDDKIYAYMLSVVIGSTGKETINDLWTRWGVQNAADGTIQGIQIAWAKAQGCTSTLTWNDAMGTLPP